MKKTQPSVTYVYRGQGRDVPWQLLIREIADRTAGNAPMALVINCSVAGDDQTADCGDNKARQYQKAGVVARSEKRLTIVDVARLAGVSRMTVSRVLNNQDGVSPQIHAHVRAVVDAVGYSLNESARALALGRLA